MLEMREAQLLKHQQRLLHMSAGNCYRLVGRVVMRPPRER